MALALADSILAVGWDLDDQARRYVDWWRNGRYSVNGTCFDIGNTVSAALRRFEQTGDARTSGPAGERQAGNGSIMRLAPVPVAYFDAGLPKMIIRSVESSLPTHRAPQCRSACAYMAALLWSLFAGTPKEDALGPDSPALPVIDVLDLLDDRIRTVVTGSFRREPPDIRGSGYVVESLEAALWAFDRADDFESAVLAAVNLGDDADTTGAVCGQIAGAHWGIDGIPDHLLDGLAQSKMIQRVARRLAVFESLAEE